VIRKLPPNLVTNVFQSVTCAYLRFHKCFQSGLLRHNAALSRSFAINSSE